MCNDKDDSAVRMLVLINDNVGEDMSRRRGNVQLRKPQQPKQKLFPHTKFHWAELKLN